MIQINCPQNEKSDVFIYGHPNRGICTSLPTILKGVHLNYPQFSHEKISNNPCTLIRPLKDKEK